MIVPGCWNTANVSNSENVKIWSCRGNKATGHKTVSFHFTSRCSRSPPQKTKLPRIKTNLHFSRKACSRNVHRVYLTSVFLALSLHYNTNPKCLKTHILNILYLSRQDFVPHKHCLLYFSSGI